MSSLDAHQVGRLMWSQIWQVTVMAMAVGLTVRLACRRRPHLGYLLWMLVVVKCLAPPLWSSPIGLFSWIERGAATADRPGEVGLAALMPAADTQETLASHRTPDQRIRSPGSLAGRAGHAEGGGVAHPGAPGDTVLPTSQAQPGFVAGAAAPRRPEPAVGRTTVWALGGVWLLGAATAAGVIAVQRFRFRRWLARSCRPPSPAIEGLALGLCRRLGLRRRVRLWVTAEPVIPAAFGIWRPAVLLPEQLVTQRPPSEIEPIVGHELLHIRRWDTLAGRLQLLAQVIWWFHPLVWWGNREARRLRERCCDQAVVVSFGFSPGGYVRSLLNVLELAARARAIDFVPGIRPFDVTVKRLEEIMRHSRDFRRRVPLAEGLLAALLGLVVLPGAGLVLGTSAAQPEDVGTAAGAAADAVAAVGEPAKAVPPARKQADDAALKEYLKQFEAMKPGEGNFLILPLRTELQRSGSRSGYTLCVIVNTAAVVPDRRTLRTDQLDGEALLRKLQMLPEKDKGPVYFFSRGVRTPEFLKAEGAATVDAAGKPRAGAYAGEILGVYLNHLAESMPKPKPGTLAPGGRIIGHDYEPDSPWARDWPAIVADLTAPAEAVEQESPVGDEVVRVYPVRTALSRLFYKDADAVVRILPPLNTLKLADVNGIHQKIRRYVRDANLKRRNLIQFQATWTKLTEDLNVLDSELLDPDKLKELTGVPNLSRSSILY